MAKGSDEILCEKCGSASTSVMMVKLGPYEASVGYLCTGCKVKINEILIPLARKHFDESYSAATKWINPDKYYLAE